MVALGWIVLFLVVLGTLVYLRAGLPVSTLCVAIYLIGPTVLGAMALPWAILLWALFVVAVLPLNLKPLRRRLISARLLGWFRNVLPEMSDTEREALEAGTVWWDAEIFSGRPRWKQLMDYPAPALSEEERTFLDGPVEELCEMLNEWEISRTGDLPPQAWRFIKEKRFWAMIIPKEYGGLGFSAVAHSEVIMKIASRSGVGAVTVMVPNSLGPAELLMRYGSDGQRDYYLPRLARGEEIPCFALTGPEAGSDAGAMPDTGIVCKGRFNGEEVLGLRLNWEKRYITLGPVATLLGLAFKAYDPDHLLGDREELGISLALIPTDTAGVSIGRRHNPLDSLFQNGPNWGKDVFIPMDYVVGGEQMLGQGWRMLMNCLSVGRSISLPASGTGAAKFCAWATGNYARIRKQFRIPVGKFEGVQESMGRIGGNAYLMDATRLVTANAADQGEEASVLSSIVKYHLTERMRSVINDAMDVHGGKGICLGPNNYLGRGYQAAPISITVEGANLLTRNMIIFGQGAIRCHPYILKEMLAAQSANTARAERDFDDAFFRHVGFTLSNAVRSLLLGLTAGRLARVPAEGPLRVHLRHISRMAASFALFSDVSMLVLGGSLKRRERISARLGDALSNLYMASAVAKRFHDQGRLEADEPLLEWCMKDTLHRAQQAMDETLRNFPSRGVAILLRGLIFPLGKRHHPPEDSLVGRIAEGLLEPGADRDRLVEGIHISHDREDITAKLAEAVNRVLEAEPIERKIDHAVRSGELKVRPGDSAIAAARSAGIITPAEAESAEAGHRAVRAVIDVDDFAPSELAPPRAQPIAAEAGTR